MYTGHLPKLVINDVVTLCNEALTIFTLCLCFLFGERICKLKLPCNDIF